MSEDRKTEKSTDVVEFIFATSQPRRVLLSADTEAPGRWEEGLWYPVQQIVGLDALFNRYTGEWRTTDPIAAKLLMEKSCFRTKKDGAGNVWLVKKHVIDTSKGEVETSPAPPVKPQVTVVKGTRGTAAVVRKG